MLRGKKIFLRAAELEDARILSAWLNDRESNQYLDIIYPLSKRYADSFVLEEEADNAKKLFIIDNADMKPIGIVVLDNIKWEYRNCEIGVAIYDKNSRRKGYGTDAVATAVKFCFDDMNMHLVYLRVNENNRAAADLYESLGFVKEGLLKDRCFKDGKYSNIIIMSKINEREK